MDVVKKSGTVEKIDVVRRADAVIKSLSRNPRDKDNKFFLKTNQIRKFLTAVNILANKVSVYKAENPGTDTLSDDLANEVKYLEVMLVYQVGRDNAQNPKIKSVKEFVDKSNIREIIGKIGYNIYGFEEFSRYIEALVAFHKFYGGMDK